MIKKLARSLLQKNPRTHELLALLALSRQSGYLRQAGWLESFCSGLPYDQHRQPIQWLTYAATAFLEARVNREMRVFEYGSRYSTIWWSKHVADPSRELVYIDFLSR